MNSETLEMSYIPFEVYEPLSWRKQSDGKLHLVDVEGNEDHGFIVDDDKLQTYNNAVNWEDFTLIHNVSDIDHAQLGDIGFVEIHYKNGDIYVHQERLGLTEEERRTIELDPIDYKSKDYYTSQKVLKKSFPGIEKALYRDKLDGRLMMNTTMFGGDKGCIPLLNKDSPAVTNICLSIESEVHQIQTSKGLINIHYETNPSNIFAIMKSIADSHERNLFIETIRRVRWDGNKRIRTFLKSVGCSAFGLSKAEEAVYLELVMEGFLLSVLERNLKEEYSSIQFVPVIVGGQGVGKSTLCEILALRTYHRSCAVSVSEQRRFYESCQGAVIVEMKEATQFRTDDDAELKATIDSTQIQYRKAYAADSSVMPIYYSFIVTTNDEGILSDQSGNRRYFPVKMNSVVSGEDNHPIIFDVDPDDVLQMWAEALVLYKEGFRWHSRLNTDQIKPIVQYMQSSATTDTQESEDIFSFVETYAPELGDTVTTKDLEDYLKIQLNRSDYDVRAAKQQFGKNRSRYGFEFKGDKYVTSGLTRIRTRVYERIVPRVNIGFEEETRLGV